MLEFPPEIDEDAPVPFELEVVSDVPLVELAPPPNPNGAPETFEPEDVEAPDAAESVADDDVPMDCDIEVPCD